MAIKELAIGSSKILKQAPKNKEKGDNIRLITIGGDHTISILSTKSLHYIEHADCVQALPALRATFPVWGPVAVLHFDSHLDTWDPIQIGGNKTEYAEITHGTMLHIAHEEGLLTNRSMHIGSRSKLIDKYYDLNHDESCGFSYIRAREMDVQGADKIIQRILEHVQGQPVYISIDIDVLDPGKLHDSLREMHFFTSIFSIHTRYRNHRTWRMDVARAAAYLVGSFKRRNEDNRCRRRGIYTCL